MVGRYILDCCSDGGAAIPGRPSPCAVMDSSEAASLRPRLLANCDDCMRGGEEIFYSSN
jgi:hypothetical protein